MVLEMTFVLHMRLSPNEKAQGLFHQVEGGHLVHRAVEGAHQVLREAVVGHQVTRGALEEKVNLEGEAVHLLLHALLEEAVVETPHEEETELHLEIQRVVEEVEFLLVLQ